MAQAWNTAVVPHVWGSGIGLAASLQLIATLPPTPLSLQPEEPSYEYDRSSHPFREDLIGGMISAVDGKVAVPQGSGIGVEVDRAVLRAVRQAVPLTPHASERSGDKASTPAVGSCWASR